MIHTTRPAAASAKCPKITAGGKWLVRGVLVPPLAIQVPSRTKPPMAVTTQAISAAMDMISLLVNECDVVRIGGFAVSVGVAADRPTGADRLVTAGLGGLVDDPHAVAEGQLPTQIAGYRQAGQADRGQHQRPDGHRAGVAVVGVPPEEVTDVRADDQQVETH